MTLEEINTAINKYGTEIVKIILVDGTKISGILHGAYNGHPDDPRGYTEPYLHIMRVDVSQNPIEKYNCVDISTIQ